MAEARPYHHGDLRRALIDAARRLLESEGPSALSLRAVAREAGVSPAAPYHHFKDRAALLYAIAHQGNVALNEAMKAAFEGSEPGRDRIIAVGVTYVEFALKNPALYRLMFETTRLYDHYPDGSEAEGEIPRIMAATFGATLPARKSEMDRHLAAMAGWSLFRGLAEVGAPVDRRDPCIPNIGIIFSAQPQASLMSIATARPFLVQGGSQKPEVRYPVQAWYATFKTDYDGFKTIDIPWEITESWREGPPQVAANVSRLHTGQTAEMAAATVLVDTKAVTGMTLGEIGDYLAVMTLAQASQYGACQPMATIANLMLKGCDPADVTRDLSHVDIALLTALYQVPDIPEKLQKQRIVGAMRRSLEQQFGSD